MLLSMVARGQDFNPDSPPEPGARYKLTVKAQPAEAATVSGGGLYAVNANLDDRFTLTFEAPTTGINTVATDADADNAIYTIDGRRVNSTAQKGIYIQNHKKIVK